MRAAYSPRMEAVHRQTGAELRLFVLQLPPSWTFERMAARLGQQGGKAALVSALEGLLHLDEHIVVAVGLRGGGLL